MQTVGLPGDYILERHGLQNLRTVYWNLTPASIIEQIIARQEAALSETGAVIVHTGKHTGRSPQDKYIVRNKATENLVHWGKVNQPMEEEQFQVLFTKLRAYLQGRDVFVQDLMAGAHPDHQFPIRLITEKAWAALFAYNLFIRLSEDRLVHHIPRLTVIHCPTFLADPIEDKTRTGTFVALNLEKQIVLIGGTSYAGEIKKSVFSVLNFALPAVDVLPMHCSANVDSTGDTALFFGLSGTGKTTLSSDANRDLIGDDEHGWSDSGVFNFEGGCYAKTIHLRPELEPLIWQAVHRFGAVLENVSFDPIHHHLDLDDDHLTENTRGAYPIHFIPNHVPSGYAGHPSNIFFLTADAFGVLPPIARLTNDQAEYYFLSGYTAKLAGTETGLGSEPQATFSACFGAPFLPLPPTTYAGLLRRKITRHNVKVWLVNTGWTGGSFGTGQRIKLAYTRAMIRAALSGELANTVYHKEPFFGLEVPETCPGVPPEILDPAATWSDRSAYSRQASMLAGRFTANFQQFIDKVSIQVADSGPASMTREAV